jgi:hypothetical protein
MIVEWMTTFQDEPQASGYAQPLAMFFPRISPEKILIPVFVFMG